MSGSYLEVGSSCISERRAIEMVDTGKPVTAFMSFGESIFMEARNADGNVLLGAINQRVTQR